MYILRICIYWYMYMYMYTYNIYIYIYILCISFFLLNISTCNSPISMFLHARLFHLSLAILLCWMFVRSDTCSNKLSHIFTHTSLHKKNHPTICTSSEDWTLLVKPDLLIFFSKCPPWNAREIPHRAKGVHPWWKDNVPWGACALHARNMRWPPWARRCRGLGFDKCR